MLCVLQCVAVCCSVLQCVAVCCSVWHSMLYICPFPRSNHTYHLTHRRMYSHKWQNMCDMTCSTFEMCYTSAHSDGHSCVWRDSSHDAFLYVTTNFFFFFRHDMFYVWRWHHMCYVWLYSHTFFVCIDTKAHSDGPFKCMTWLIAWCIPICENTFFFFLHDMFYVWRWHHMCYVWLYTNAHSDGPFKCMMWLIAWSVTLWQNIFDMNCSTCDMLCISAHSENWLVDVWNNSTFLVCETIHD